MTRSPDLPKPADAVALNRPGPWPNPLRALGRHRAALAALSGLAVLLLATWAVPPMLDWGRFRGTIASIAAARLGRPVRIGGEVTLVLLPRAVLTAGEVTLPDQGDGVSATIASLRLEVALLPLLAGRLAPRDLVLGTPVLRLPWPLPGTLAAPSRPRVPRAFAARLDEGTLLIGGARIDGINAALHSGPEGAMPAEPVAQGFGAEGFAAFAGRSWRFTSALGAPDADGVSALDLSVSGQGPAAHTDATLRGTLADGVLQGRLVAGGPDLSLLLPTSALSWRAEAPFVADGTRITAPSVSLSLGGSPAEGALALDLTQPARLKGRLHAASIDFDGWVGTLPARLAAGPARPGLLGQIDISADRAKLLGGTLTAPRGTLTMDGSALALTNGEATLPGGARLTVSGKVEGAPDGVHLFGPATLDAPALRQTLAWLRPLAPSLEDAIPAGVLTRAKLAGTARIGGRTLSVSKLSGEIDGDHVTGGFGADLGPHPHLAVGLAVSRLSLDTWLGAFWPAQLPSLSRLGRAAAQLSTDIHLQADTAIWRGHELSSLRVDAQTGVTGLALDGAAFDAGAAHVEVRGGVAADGAVSDGALGVTAHGPAGLSAWLPAAWGWAAPLWRNEARLNATLSGPPQDLSVQLRADAGDLVLEADGETDADLSRATGTVTLRHPGAPRLLESLGVAGAEHWLGTGSLALRARVIAGPDGMSVEDFDLRAADVGLGGHVTLDRTAEPSWTGVIAASQLSLPDPGQIAGLERAAHDLSARIGWTAAELGLGGREVARDAAGTIAIAHGDGLVDITRAEALGGRAAGQIAVGQVGGRTAWAARVSLAGADAAELSPGLPVGADSGRADILADLTDDGAAPWPARLSGQLQIFWRDVTLTGFDLGDAEVALAGHGKAAREALARALSHGETAGLSGAWTVALTDGHALLAPTRLAAGEGGVLAAGSADLSAGSLDVLFEVSPGVGVRLSGPWTGARAQVLTGPPVAHAHLRHRPG